MQKGLQEILELSGVETCVVVDNHGSTIRKMGSIRLNNEQLDEICALILHSLTTLERNGAGSDELEFYFEHNQVLTRDLEQAVLYVICKPAINISLLRMTTNVVLSRWKKSPDVKKTLKKHAVSRVEGENLSPSSDATQVNE